MSVKDTAQRLVEACYDGRDEAMSSMPSLREYIEMLYELERMEENRKKVEKLSRQPQQATPVITEKPAPESPATQAKLPETATAGADVPEARLEATEPGSFDGFTAMTVFSGKGASEKREIFERLKAYRAERGLGCLKKLAAASNGILDENQIRNMLDGQKETLQNWKILGAALDYEEQKKMNEYNLTTNLIAAIETRKGELERMHSANEAYAVLLNKYEVAGNVGGSIGKCMKELWAAVKEGNEDAVAAYAREIESVARSTAAAYAELAACAGIAEESA